MVDIFDKVGNRPMVETAAPLGGHKDWNRVLKAMPVPNVVSSNPILLSALESLIVDGRIDRQLALKIYNEPDLNAIFALANMAKLARFDNQIFFNQNLHVNTTNICVLACRFCAFRKGPRHTAVSYTHLTLPTKRIV